MISTHAKEWFSSYYSVSAIIIWLIFGLSGQSKETILVLLIYIFMGLVAKFGHWMSFIAAMVLSVPGANLFL